MTTTARLDPPPDPHPLPARTVAEDREGDAVRGAPAIEVRGLRKSYGTTPVLDGLDLTVAPGRVTVLLGPNGAGKTTTVRVLATLLAPDAGTARVSGYDVVRERREVRRRLSLTGQATTVDAQLTGEENLRVVARLAGLGRRDARRRTRELLAQVGLDEAGGRRVAAYSGGMRRRLDLALGLVTVPEVMLLDEPTTGLDPRSRHELWRAVEELARAGTTVLLTTQYLEEADRLAGHVAVLDRGRIVAEGTPAQLKHRVAPRRLVLTLAGPRAHADAVAALGDAVLAADPAALTVSVPGGLTAPELRALLDRVDPARTGVTAFDDHEASLDEVFLALTSPTGARS
ncbi:MAG: ATP-binding cassette domain-containing protein [Kineosporiaceae bacterium]